MLEWIFFACTIIILAVLAIRKPLWLIPLLALAVALEISSAWYPEIEQAERAIGMISLTRLTSFTLILAALVRLLYLYEMRRKFKAIFNDPLTILLFIFFLFGAASVVYSADTGKTLVESARLLVLFAVFVSIALLIDKENALLPFKAVYLASLALAPLTFYEGFTGKLIWQGEHLLQESTIRVNATFVDPNIFARYLVLGIAAGFVLQLYTRQTSHKFLYMAGSAVLLCQLALTGSRGGAITLLVILVAALIFLPNRKAPLWILGLAVLFGGIVFMGRPDLWERMLSVTELAGSQRLYLWKAALAIFADHPIFGTGLGTFQTVFESDYSHFRNFYGPDGATISHTTVLTIASELGVVGLTVLAGIWAVIFGKLYKLYGVSHDYRSIFYNFRNEYYMGTGYFLWILAIFVSSQGEGRFFEDPVFWLSCALLVVLRFSRSYDIRLN